jgi:preprotein translocase subunit SecD
VLAVLIIVMLAGVLRGNIVHPARWHDSFKVGLGLDLSSGTTVTLTAVSKGHKAPSSGDMTEARTIINNRVNGQGFSGAQVQQLGSNDIVVSVPGQGAQKVVGLVGETAQLRFRQVLLCTGVGTQCIAQSAVTPTASSSTSPSASASPSTTPSPSSSASPSSSTPAKAAASPSPSTGGGTGQAVKATRLGAASASSSPTASSSPKPSSSPSASSSAAASPSPSTPASSTAPETTGTKSLVNAATLALFNKVNCADKNWKQQAYGSSTAFDDPNSQIVSCDAGIKYALDKAPVVGQDLTGASAALNSSSQWVVNFNLNGKGSNAFANLTTSMVDKYYSSSSAAETSVLDQFAIVLDGAVISAPQIQSAITGGAGMITGPGNSGFTQAGATQLANVLKYGALPLTFHTQDVSSVSPELGTAQLQAGLAAAAIGLLLVVIYSFLYYRGLGLVSVSSLIIAALLSYLSVVLLSKYEGYTLSLDGVAGLIVAIGITADSFVVYFERLRDEVREGRTLRAAVERGWGRARRTILVSDTVSFLAAALLYLIAVGDVKGFAYTLGLTTLIDVVVVFLFTKPMVTLLSRTKFYGQGHKLSGLDPARLGARSPWRGSRRPRPRPATGTTGAASSAQAARTTPKEA